MKIPSTPFSLGTKNDCARGSDHRVAVFSVTTSSTPSRVLSLSLVTGWLSTITWLWIWGCLIDKTCSSKFCWIPLEKKVTSTALSPGSKSLSLVGLVVSLMLLAPVVNCGLDRSNGSGICKQHDNVPLSSVISSIFSTLAIANPEESSSPGLTNPLRSGIVNNAKSAVSMFRKVLVFEYVAGRSS